LSTILISTSTDSTTETGQQSKQIYPIQAPATGLSNHS